jgi:hypothetical protein
MVQQASCIVCITVSNEAMVFAFCVVVQLTKGKNLVNGALQVYKVLLAALRCFSDRLLLNLLR